MEELSTLIDKLESSLAPAIAAVQSLDGKAVTGDTVPRRPPVPVPAPPATGRPRVLVVDDEPANNELFAYLLGDEYEVLRATDGISALEIAAAKAPDVVLLDVMMPGIDGYEVCRRLIEQHPGGDLPVLFVTGSIDEAAEGLAMEAGAVDYITKPIYPSAVRARVKNHVALKLARAEVSRQLAREHSRAFAESLIESSPAAIIVTGVDYIINAVNPAAEKLLWYRREELIARGTPLMFYDHAQVAVRAKQLSADMGTAVGAERAIFLPGTQGGKAHEGEWTFVRKGGSTVIVQVSVTPLKSDVGAPTGFMITAYDVSERKRREEYISHLAHHDVLTGLPTRQLLMDRLEMMLSRSQRFSTRSALLMIDLNNFKHVNDSLGHHVGDRLLVQVADRLRTAVRAMDTVARMGGDEFVVLVSDLDSVAGAERVAEKLLTAFQGSFVLTDQSDIDVTASVGVCVYPDGGTDASALLRNADIAMYHAKATRRHSYQVFDQKIAEEVLQQRELESALARALEAGELTLHYQPQFSLANSGMVGVEALLRWNSLQFGSVSPVRFIPVAESSGLILPIGAWVIRTACDELRRLQRRFGTGLVMAVNLSARQLEQPDLLMVIQDALKKNSLDPACLEIEITESLLMSDSVLASAFFEGLRALGVRVAIDDFGTGFSSMSYLLRFSINRLKIDRCFIQDSPSNTNSATVTSAIIALAHQLKVSVVAEGVETDEQMDFLRVAGCDDVQGFHLGRPVLAEQLAPMEKYSSLERAAARLHEPPDLGAEG